MIVLVCGFGRCGSSLAMQMLAAGGMRCLGDFPSFEDERIHALPNAPELLDAAEGGALKLLDPHRQAPRRDDRNYRCIWIDRDIEEQARSFMKFGAYMFGLATGRREMRAFKRSLHRDRPRALGVVQGLGPTLLLTFEGLLARPEECAVQIADHVGRPLDVVSMAGARVPRHPRCLPGMLEAALLQRRLG